MRQIDGVQGLGQGANLVDLDQDRVGQALADAHAEPRRVGDKQIVAHQLDFATKLVGQQLPALEIILAAAVLDGDDGELGDQIG